VGATSNMGTEEDEFAAYHIEGKKSVRLILQGTPRKGCPGSFVILICSYCRFSFYSKLFGDERDGKLVISNSKF
jgi:hypothetical protein